jgi:hypothetical protein
MFLFDCSFGWIQHFVVCWRAHIEIFTLNQKNGKSLADSFFILDSHYLFRDVQVIENSLEARVNSAGNGLPDHNEQDT